MTTVSSSIKPRPERPAVGPQSPYILVGHNIGLCTRDPAIHFEEGEVLYRAGLEWTLYHLECFDEPSRHMILAGTAVHFGMSFETVMGGML